MQPIIAFLVVIVVLALFVILPSLRICSEWQRKVVLRLGRFAGVRGPGIFFLVPYIETTPFTIDMRVVTTRLSAEQTLTRDGASVSVETLVYWQVIDAGMAALRVADYTAAVLGAAQGALRDIIGRNDLATILSQRRELDEQLTVILDEQTEPWGIKVQSVQLLDIRVPEGLQEALARLAQAERERQARVVLGESEVAVAQSFAQAGEIYSQSPTALHLRGMNMLYETMRSGLSSVIVVPSSAIDTMNLGAIAGISSLSNALQPGAGNAAASTPVGGSGAPLDRPVVPPTGPLAPPQPPSSTPPGAPRLPFGGPDLPGLGPP